METPNTQPIINEASILSSKTSFDFQYSRSSYIFNFIFSRIPTPKSLHDIFLLWIAICYATTCLYLVSVGNSIADKMNISNYLTQEQRASLILPDPLMHFSHPYYKMLNFSKDASDFLVAVAAFLLFLRPLLLHRECFTVLRRILFILGTMYLLRAFTVSLTVLPNPFAECHSRPEDNILYNAALIITSQRVTCGDVFFSGHTIIFTLSLWTWRTYPVYKVYGIKLLITLFNVWSMWILVAAMFHYTIDVLVSFLLTSSLWHFYHFAVYSDELRQYPWCQFLKRLDDPDYHSTMRFYEDSSIEDSTDWDSASMIIDIALDQQLPTLPSSALHSVQTSETHLEKSQQYQQLPSIV